MWTPTTLKLIQYKKNSILVHNLFPLKGILWRWTLVFLSSEGGLGCLARLEVISRSVFPFTVDAGWGRHLRTGCWPTWGGVEELSGNQTGLPCCQDGNRARLPFFFSSSIVPWSRQSHKEQVGRRPHNLSIMPHMIKNDNWKQYTTGFTEISFWKFSSFSLKTCLTPWCTKQSHFFPHKKSVYYKTFSLLG